MVETQAVIISAIIIKAIDILRVVTGQAGAVGVITITLFTLNNCSINRSNCNNSSSSSNRCSSSSSCCNNSNSKSGRPSSIDVAVVVVVVAAVAVVVLIVIVE